MIEKRVYEIKGEQSLLVGIPDVSIQRHPTPRNSSTSVVRDRIKIKETGFFAVFGCVSIFSEKTRFLATPKIKETGFLQFFGGVSMLLEKTRFLRLRITLPNSRRN